MLNEMRLPVVENKKNAQCVVVTGGSRGIGKAILDGFSRQGANVESISRANGYDLSKRGIRRGLLCNCETDVLVNCAGAQCSYSAIDYPIEQWDYDLELNLTAVFDLCQQAAGQMLKRGGGKIINITSIAGIQGTRNIIGYSVAKAGLIEMTKCLSNEWAPHNIQVNAVAPGHFETDMLKSLVEDETRAAVVKGRIPAGRFGKPEDVVGSVLFLASRAADYITGTTLVVDGGWIAR